MQNIISALQEIINSFIHNILFIAIFVAIFWLAHFINLSVNYRLSRLGIWPRRYRGIWGIFFSPFLHDNFNHLFFNTLPLFVLSGLVLTNNKLTFYYVTIVVIILGGFLLWLFGRKAIHIGASSLIMGYFGFLLARAYYQFNAVAIILACLSVYYFSGLILMLLPGGKKVSWEGHVFGFLAGIAAAYSYLLFPK